MYFRFWKCIRISGNASAFLDMHRKIHLHFWEIYLYFWKCTCTSVFLKNTLVFLEMHLHFRKYIFENALPFLPKSLNMHREMHLHF